MSEPRVVAPETLDAALALLQDEDAIAVAGGTSIGIMLRARLLDARTIVDLGRLKLAWIDRAADGAITVGGTTTLRQIARSEPIAHAAAALTEAAAVVGNPRVRAVATLGGAIVHHDPRQDVPPALLALGGTVHLASADGERDVPLAEFFTGLMETACGDDELVTHVEIRPEHPYSAYVRFNPASADDYPVVGAAAALAFDESGRISSARIGLAGVGPTARIAEQASRLLIGERPGDEVFRAAGEAVRAVCDPTTDRRGSADYKRQMAAVISARALARAGERRPRDGPG